MRGKIVFSKIIAIILTVLWTGGMCVSADETIAVKSIKITVTNTQMLIGETQKLKVAVMPNGADGYELEYLSSNPEAVTAAVGTVIANTAGTADITVRVKDTGISDTVTITVVAENDVIPVTDIKLGDDYIYLDRYDEERIYYDVIPADATNPNVTFTSLDTSVATVSGTGVVYARKAGTTEIKVQSEDGNAVKYITVVVYDDYEYPGGSGNVPVRGVDIYDGEDLVTGTVEIMISQTKAFTASIYPSSATDKRIRWRSSDSGIAQVSEIGVVKGVSEGTVKIYASARDNGRQDIITVKIVPYVRYPDSISILPEENAVYETGKTIQFSPVFHPADTTEQNLRWYVYSSNATVDNSGNVTIIDKGKVTVKVYTFDWKQSVTHEFEAVYGNSHFTQIAEGYNVKTYRPIVIDFDTEVSSYSAQYNVFASTDGTGTKTRLIFISRLTAGE
jgi:uncharacterized protein YjdB